MHMWTCDSNSRRTQDLMVRGHKLLTKLTMSRLLAVATGMKTLTRLASEAGKPNVGENKPADVTADIAIDTSSKLYTYSC